MSAAAPRSNCNYELLSTNAKFLWNEKDICDFSSANGGVQFGENFTFDDAVWIEKKWRMRWKREYAAWKSRTQTVAKNSFGSYSILGLKFPSEFWIVIDENFKFCLLGNFLPSNFSSTRPTSWFLMRTDEQIISSSGILS